MKISETDRQQQILEIIVCTVEDAVAAELGGANRLEIISHYEVGGQTPTFDSSIINL